MGKSFYCFRRYSSEISRDFWTIFKSSVCSVRDYLNSVPQSFNMKYTLLLIALACLATANAMPRSWDGEETEITGFKKSSSSEESSEESSSSSEENSSEENSSGKTTTTSATSATEEQESTTGEPTTTIAPPNYTAMCRGIVVDLLPNPVDCTQFVLCVMGRFEVNQCEDGHIFYPSVRVCGVGSPDECEIWTFSNRKIRADFIVKFIRFI